MRFRIKPPTSYKAAYKLYLAMQSKALVLGPSALRRYPSARGPFDAECVDATVETILDFIRAGSRLANEVSQLHKAISFLYWEAGQFARASHFAELAAGGLPSLEKVRVAEQLRFCRAGLYPTDAVWIGDDEPSPDRERVRQALANAHELTPKDRDAVVADPEEVQGTHAPLLDLPHSVGFSKQTPLGALIDAGNDLRTIWSPDPLPLRQFVSRDNPPRELPKLSFDAPMMIVIPEVFDVLAEHLPQDTCIQRASLDDSQALFVIQLAECDCLIPASSTTIRRKSGRLNVWRGMFDMTATGDRKLFRPTGSLENFVAPAFVKPMKALLRQIGQRDARLLDDVADRI